VVVAGCWFSVVVLTTVLLFTWWLQALSVVIDVSDSHTTSNIIDVLVILFIFTQYFWFLPRKNSYFN